MNPTKPSRIHNEDSRRDWSTKELAYLRAHRSEGARTIADVLERSVKSVQEAARRHRVSLRTRNARGGRLLSQPTRDEIGQIGVSRWEEYRGLVLDGTFDVTDLEERSRIAATDTTLCPSCGKRPQRRQTGLCGVCHFEELRIGTEETLAELEALRGYNASKQRLHRIREEAIAL